MEVVIGDSVNRKQLNCLVVIEGDSGVGTGSICQYNGAYFVITNTHILSGQNEILIRTTEGETVPFSYEQIWIAGEEDVAIIRIETPEEYLVVAGFDEVDLSINIRCGVG